MDKLKSSGERLNFLRKLINLKLNDFLSLANISRTMLKLLEMNMITLNTKDIKHIIEGFKSLNLIVSEQWIISGKGEKPYIIFNAKDNLLSHLKTVDLKVPNFLAYVNEHEVCLYISSRFKKVFNLSLKVSSKAKLEDIFEGESYNLISEQLSKALAGEIKLFTYYKYNPNQSLTSLKLHFLPLNIKDNSKNKTLGCYLFYIP